MSIEVSAATVSAPIQNMERSKMKPRSAGFHPTIWGDYFLSPASDSLEKVDDDIKQEHQKLKNELKMMLVAEIDKTSEQFKLIDAIQRLGVSYHFEKEINLVLQQMHLSHIDCDIGFNDLYTISLKFRLFRQNGYEISCEIFNNFKDDKGNFKESLKGDVKGLLELYEAAHLRMHGEHILEEALAFTTTHLEFAETSLHQYPLSAQVSHARKRPIRNGLQRLEARRFISIYQEDGSHDETLLKFAKLDFNLLQNLHKEELSKISRWWKDLDFARKLPFARDRLVECYFWILGVYFEPQYSFARQILTKAIALASTMDDIYDVYGTFEELQLFTNAIERWDSDSMCQLPEYMKLFYKALLDVYKEMEEALITEGKSYRVQYAKDTMKQLSQAYFVEAKWYHESYVPTLEEYMTNALISAGYIMVAVTSLVGMGHIVTKNTFHWASNNPKIVRASSIIARLMDDIVSHKFEQERGHVASAVECYMKQYRVSEEKACNELNKQVENAWMDINEELVRPTVGVPMPVLIRILNLARVIDFLYKEGDGYTHVGEAAKSGITSLLIDPIPM